MKSVVKIPPFLPRDMSALDAHRPESNAWQGLVVLACFIGLMAFTHNDREDRYERWKRRNVIVVRGSVLVAECSYDAASNRMICENLIVEYPDSTEPDAELVRRSFSLADLGDVARDLSNIPRSGDDVIVSYQRNRPSTASVVALM